MKYWWLKFHTRPETFDEELRKRKTSGDRFSIVEDFCDLIIDDKPNETQKRIFTDLLLKSIITLEFTRDEIIKCVPKKLRNAVWKKLIKRDASYKKLYYVDCLTNFLEKRKYFNELLEDENFLKLHAEERNKMSYDYGLNYLEYLNEPEYFDIHGKFYFFFEKYEKALNFFKKSGNMEYKKLCLSFLPNKINSPQYGVVDLENDELNFLKKFLRFKGRKNFEKCYEVVVGNLNYCRYKFMGLQLLKHHIIENEFPLDYEKLINFIPPQSHSFHHLFRNSEDDCIIMFYLVYFCVTYVPKLILNEKHNLLTLLFSFYKIYSPLIVLTLNHYFPNECKISSDLEEGIAIQLTSDYISKCKERLLPGHPVIGVLESLAKKKVSLLTKKKNISGVKRKRVEFEKSNEKKNKEEELRNDVELNHKIFSGGYKEIDFPKDEDLGPSRKVRKVQGKYLVNLSRRFRNQNDLHNSNISLQNALNFCDSLSKTKKSEYYFGKSTEYDVLLVKLMNKVEKLEEPLEVESYKEELSTLMKLVDEGVYPSVSDLGSLLQNFVELSAWDEMYSYFHHFLGSLDDESSRKLENLNDSVFICHFGLSIHQVVRVGGKEAMYALLDSLLIKEENQVELTVKWEVFHFISRKIQKNRSFLKKLCGIISLAILSLRSSDVVANKGTLYLDNFKAIVRQDLTTKMIAGSELNVGMGENGFGEDFPGETYSKWEGKQSIIDISLIAMLKETLEHLCSKLCREEELFEEKEEGVKEDVDEDEFDNEDEYYHIYFVLLGDLYFETQRFRDAIKFYFLGVKIQTKNFTMKMKKKKKKNGDELLVNMVFVKRITHCLLSLGKFSIAFVLNQFIGDSCDTSLSDGLKRFDLKWIIFVWKTSFLDVLKYVAEMNKDAERYECVINQIDRASKYYSNTSNKKTRKRLKILKASFLKRVYGEFVL